MNKKVIIGILLFLFLAGCKPLPYKIEETKPLMSTLVTITIIDNDATKANAAMQDAFNELQRIESVMSIYNASSEAYRLNEDGYLENASNELLFVIKKSLYYSNLTNGAFDITVQPVLDLYTEAYNVEKRVPTDKEIETAQQLVNYKDIIIDGNRIMLAKKGMKITLGGIAKGYAVGQAISVLEKHNIEHALVVAGGDLMAIGTKENNQSWSVALQNPRDRNDFITIIPVLNQAISTSGDYERYFVENKSVHHIINPKTGKSATELISVTVIGKNPIDTDALSTSVFVLGKDKGLQFMKQQHVVGLIITSDKKIYKTDGLKELVTEKEV